MWIPADGHPRRPLPLASKSALAHQHEHHPLPVPIRAARAASVFTGISFISVNTIANTSIVAMPTSQQKHDRSSD
jgi:hypothetical protein